MREFTSKIHVNFHKGEFSIIDPDTHAALTSQGNYTMVFNEGFLAYTEDTVFNTNFRYNTIEVEGQKEAFVSDCSQTMIGWFHEVNSEGHLSTPRQDHWGCFFGVKEVKDSDDEKAHIEDVEGNQYHEDGQRREAESIEAVLEPDHSLSGEKVRKEILGGSSEVTDD